MSTKKELGESRSQKGGNNGRPINPKPQVLRPKPTSSSDNSNSTSSSDK